MAGIYLHNFESTGVLPSEFQICRFEGKHGPAGVSTTPYAVRRISINNALVQSFYQIGRDFPESPYRISFMIPHKLLCIGSFLKRNEFPSHWPIYIASHHIIGFESIHQIQTVIVGDVNSSK